MACSGTPLCPFLTKEGFKSWDRVVDLVHENEINFIELIQDYLDEYEPDRETK